MAKKHVCPIFDVQRTARDPYDMEIIHLCQGENERKMTDEFFLDKKTLGKRFKEFRLSLDLTQLELGRLLNLTQTTVAGIEKGKSFPTLQVIHYLMRHQRLSARWLLLGEGDPIEASTDRAQQFQSEIADLYFYLKEIPLAREFLLEQFATFKLKHRKDFIQYWNIKKSANDL